MIEMETGTWEGVRFIRSTPVIYTNAVINKALADSAKRCFGLPILGRKAIHQQALNRLRKRR